MTFAERVAAELDEIEAMLLAKNEAYGNSALNPVRVFSKASNVEQLRVRIDDKLSRLMRGSEVANEDTTLDLIGYLVLLRVAGKANAVPIDDDDALGSRETPLPGSLCERSAIPGHALVNGVCVACGVKP
jgi:hypothetical protein